jgi:hypothetical protein
MVTAPDETPETTPVVDPTVATLVLELAHVPGVLSATPEVSVNVTGEVEHTYDGPLIATGNGLTVMTTGVG